MNFERRERLLQREKMKLLYKELEESNKALEESNKELDAALKLRNQVFISFLVKQYLKYNSLEKL